MRGTIYAPVVDRYLADVATVLPAWKPRGDWARFRSVWAAELGLLTADLRSRARILDAGCGEGFAACFLAQCFPETTVVGIDEWVEQVAIARRLAAALTSAAVFHAGRVEDIDRFAGRSRFDVVVATAVLPVGREIADGTRHEANLSQARSFLSAIRRLVAQDERARFWSLEGSRTLAGLCRHVALLAGAGFRVVWTESRLATCILPDGALFFSWRITAR
jgi:SAM-dependent methyltransferase